MKLTWVCCICFLATISHVWVYGDDTSDDDACLKALQHSEAERLKFSQKLENLTKSLTKAEEDLNLVVFGTRILYDDDTGEYEALMCEYKTTQISCTGTKKLKIISAMYGRQDTKTCYHTEIYTTDCASNKTMPYVTKKCNGESSCRVAANWHLFGDPCYYTHKYLRVIYKCVLQQ